MGPSGPSDLRYKQGSLGFYGPRMTMTTFRGARGRTAWQPLLTALSWPDSEALVLRITETQK